MFSFMFVLRFCGHFRFLQEAQDARLLRAAIVNILEEACLPGVTEEEKRKLLSFVVSVRLSVCCVSSE